MKYFKDRNCLYSGKVESFKAAYELAHEYSLETITTFVVWRTERKNFDSTDKDFKLVFCLNIQLKPLKETRFINYVPSIAGKDILSASSHYG